MTNKLYDTKLPSYREPAALQQLLTAVHQELEADCDRIDNDKAYDGGQFTITVGGVQTAFYLGGPQCEALFAFVRHIAAENFYTVDIARNTVNGD